ncbi:sugar transferase [Ellagibacter isourolithinifaciens]|uniref:sugar transferase n=1 Tax=Ellagibacter isourolithinifaciens TaxID=2137581 RepID=UPI003AAD2830
MTKGMSVIGPRPMILADNEQIEARARYGANDIRPGLTGWAQINGRDAVTVEEKAR